MNDDDIRVRTFVYTTDHGSFRHPVHADHRAATLFNEVQAERDDARAEVHRLRHQVAELTLDRDNWRERYGLLCAERIKA